MIKKQKVILVRIQEKCIKNLVCEIEKIYNYYIIL